MPESPSVSHTTSKGISSTSLPPTEKTSTRARVESPMQIKLSSGVAAAVRLGQTSRFMLCVALHPVALSRTSTS